MSLDPRGLFDLYVDNQSAADAGYQRGGITGTAQAWFYWGTTALMDTVGGSTVSGMSEASGDAAGRGATSEAVLYGAGTAGVIAVEAISFGRIGQMLPGTRQAGLEFSHSIPARMGGPRVWWNGSMVAPEVHAMIDSYRMLRGMTLADKWNFVRRFWNRLPAWMQGMTGIELMQLFDQIEKGGNP